MISALPAARAASRSRDPLEGRWVCGDFAVGDVLLFHSMTVHKGLPNRSDKLRMSMDVRYQLVSEPFNIDNANPDGQPLSWEEIYADWRSDALKYYWQRLPLTLKPFDPQWFDKRDALGFELGEAGDPRASRYCSASLRAMPARKSAPAHRSCSTRCRDSIRRPSPRQYRVDQRRSGAAGAWGCRAWDRGARRCANRRSRAFFAAVVQPAWQSLRIDRAAP